MKLQVSEIKEILTEKRLTGLTDEQLMHLGWITSMNVSKIKRTNEDVYFTVTNATNSIKVIAYKGIRCITTKRPRKMGTCWGGQETFKDMIDIIRTFCFKGYEFTMQTGDYPEYTPGEFFALSREVATHILRLTPQPPPQRNAGMKEDEE